MSLNLVMVTLLKAEAARIEQLKAKKEEKRLAEEYNDWQN